MNINTILNVCINNTQTLKDSLSKEEYENIMKIKEQKDKIDEADKESNSLINKLLEENDKIKLNYKNEINKLRAININNKIEIFYLKEQNKKLPEDINKLKLQASKSILNDVIETLKERYIQLSKDIIEKTNEERTGKNSFDENDAGLIKLKGNKQIVLQKCLTDELGFSNLKANGFEPTYNLFKKGDSIILRIESPGNCFLYPPDIEFYGEYNIIKIKGDKQKDKEPLKEDDNIHNTREYGKFLIEIPLKAEEYLLSNEAPKIEKKSGVFIVEFKLSHKVVTSVGYKMKVEEEI